MFLNLQALARALGGVVTGGQVLAPGPGHSAADRSLSVMLDAGAPDGFWVNSFSNDDWIVCRDHVRQKAGLPAFEPQGYRRRQADGHRRHHPGAERHHQVGTEQHRHDHGEGQGGDEHHRHAEGHAQHQAEQHRKAAWLWSKRQPIIGSLGEMYTKKRGYSGLLPETLGFLPASGGYPPAMIAAYALPLELQPSVLAAPEMDIKSAAVHLTRLLPDGSGRERGEGAKITIGSPLGQPIVVAPPNDLLGLAICEGIEDALSAHEATGLGAWAAGSAAFMPKLADAVPNYIECVTVFAHADPSGRRGAETLARALADRGIQVKVEGF